VSTLDQTIATYDREAAAFAKQYEVLSAGSAWAPIRELLPLSPGRLALDVGAGSGRDAAWLNGYGLEVIAAEPAEGMRREGMKRHPGLRWVDDRLPELAAVHRLGLSFDLILLSAVWMHVAPSARPRAFRKLVTLLKPSGLVVVTLRRGPCEPGRIMHPVSLGEIEMLARDHGLAVVRVLHVSDAMGRPGVTWTTVCLRLPDDGSLSLPLIRGVILNDDKSSTYKLGLLRAVAKIADAAPATATHVRSEDDRVAVPLGLVALYWIRSYLPLVAAGLPQAPNNRGPDGLGFAKAGFRQLLDLGVTAQDLRIGASFAGERAAALVAALGEARRTIINMPVRYTTLSNSGKAIFEATGRPERVSRLVSFTPEILGAWGQLLVPGPLWRTMVRLSAWIEPVLVAEWTRLIRGYALRMGLELPPSLVEAGLVWSEPGRDTGLARTVAGRLAAAGVPLLCVWSGTRLRLDSLDIDHTLPWSAWPCSDLWNLAPTSRRVNQHEKRDRLPSASTLARAREPLLNWWRLAWDSDPALARRFAAEARAALPIDEEVNGATVFAGLEWRRLRVQQDQGAPEWAGVAML
jgi:protein-L-isoaspartate O-methyltransferase